MSVVVVVGDVMNDIVVRTLGHTEVGSDTDSEIRRSPGGSGANQAAWLSSLGVPVRFYGRAGASDVEDHAAALRLAGVDAHLRADPELPTGSIVVLVESDGERSMFTDRGANVRLGDDDLPHDLDDIAHLHVSGYALFEPTSRSAVVDLIAEAVRRAVPVSTDPSSESYLREMGPALFLSATVGAETIFPNAPEARLLTGCADDHEAAHALTTEYPTVVVKLGKDGALLATRGSPPVHVDAPAAVVVDTTGAGDAFFAGYLATRCSGTGPVDAVRVAVETAAQAIGHMGGRPQLIGTSPNRRSAGRRVARRSIGEDGRVYIAPADAGLDEDEWRTFVTSQGFGHLVAAGSGRDVPIVVPTQFVLEGDEVLLHLVARNPVFEAIAEQPRVLLSVAGDWAFIPSTWKAIDDEDPRLGIPTTYYAAVQLVGTASVLDDPDRVAEILRVQLERIEPGVDVADPGEVHRQQLRAIRGLRIPVEEVHAKFKYGGNVDIAHRRAVVERLRQRRGPGDVAAVAHILRRMREPGN